MNSVDRVKQICKSKKIAISKLERDLGFSNGYIGQLKKGVFPYDRLNAIAIYLDIPIEYLANGGDETPKLSQKDEKDIAKTLEETLSQLENDQEGLMFSGEVLDDETRELLKISLENSIRVAKITAKKKFTPKKFRQSE